MNATDDELMLLTGLDEDLTPEAIHQNILMQVHQRIEMAIAQSDLVAVTSICRSLISASKVAGIGLANVLGAVNDAWSVFGVNEPFLDYMQAMTGLHIRTIERYVRVYDFMKVVPDDLRIPLQSKNIKNLIPVANAVAHGYDIEEDVWQRLVDASSFQEISAVVRDHITGQEPRSSHLQMWVDKHGSIYASQGGKTEFVGSLEVASTNETVQKAIRRLCDSAGVSKQ